MEKKYRQELENNKKQIAQNKLRWQQDLNYQRDLREQARLQQMEDDNTFQQITIETDNRKAEDNRLRHKTKMDKHLGDYDNQKQVIVSFPI